MGLVRGAGISRWRFGAPVAIHLAKGQPGASDLEASDHHSLFAHAKCNRDSVARIRGAAEFEWHLRSDSKFVDTCVLRRNYRLQFVHSH